jgi:hypothetical protein
MSFWSGAKSFFEKVGSEIEKAFGSSTTQQKAQAGIALVGAAITTISGLVGGPAASAAVSSVISHIQTWYGTISSVVQAGTPAPGSTPATLLATATASLKANVTALLTASDIKDPKTLAAVQSEADTIINEVQAIEEAFLPATPAVPVTQ